jgi:hypothetical protein
MISNIFHPIGASAATPAAQASGAVTASVTQITLPTLPATQGSRDVVYRFVVDGAQAISWAYGTNSNLTVSNGVYMLGNTVETFLVPQGTTTISVIAAATGTTLRLIPGDGQ